MVVSRVDTRQQQRLKEITPLLSHEERQRLIRAPFPTVVEHAHSGAWGGRFIRASVPIEGRRVWQATPEDEEWMRNSYKEEED